MPAYVHTHTVGFDGVGGANFDGSTMPSLTLASEGVRTQNGTVSDGNDDIYLKNEENKTPIEMALENDHWDVAKLFIKLKCI